MSTFKTAFVRVYVPIKAMIGKLICGAFSVLPLQDKVVFSNFSGKCYGDNPRYISEKLHENNPDIQIVWLQHKGYSFDVPDYVKVVQWPSVDMFYELATAKVWVDSHSKPVYIWKRKGQFYIETWHGGLGMKKIELDAEEQFDYGYLATTKHNVKLADLFISNCTWLSELYRRAFQYKGEILECGYPKNDIFFQNDNSRVQTKVRKQLGLHEDERIVLYAPTFRNGGDHSWFDIDLERLHQELVRKYNGKWTVLVKLHPMMMHEGKVLFQQNDHIKDVSAYPDMQELIIATDVYITDYSSGIFDFSFLKRMGLLYASDYQKYQKEQRELYWDLRELPFPFADDMDELIANIDQFDECTYKQALEDYYDLVGLKESGSAAEQIAELILKKIRR